MSLGTFSAITLGMPDMDIDLQAELGDSIVQFEQFLSVEPDNRAALEFLWLAYQQLGDEGRALNYALALTKIVLRKNDTETAADLVKALEGSSDPQAQIAVLRLRVLLSPKPDLTVEQPEQCLMSAMPAVAAKAELSLLARLVADGVLSERLVLPAFEQLQNLPTAGGAFLISALLILEKENLVGAADAAAAVAKAADTPPVPLEAYEIASADVRRLPEKLVKVRGVIPFARLGDEWAVAVLNPLDEVLRNEIAATLGAKCHFFLAPPSVIEDVLARVFADDGAALHPPAVPSSAVHPSAGAVLGEMPPVGDPLKSLEG